MSSHLLARCIKTTTLTDAVQVAFGEDGTPSKALQGFCRKNAVDPKAATVEGDYVWADVQSGGQSTLEVSQFQGLWLEVGLVWD